MGASPYPALPAQVLRFGLTGGVLSAIGAVTYFVPAVYLGVEPLFAYLLSHVVAVVAGYLLHSRVSFAGHGGRDRALVRGSRFAAVSFVSLGLNSLLVWLLTGPLGLSPWWPLVPMAVVTPAVTFLLNRHWVFARR